MEKFNEIEVTVDRREMGMGRAVFLMIATLLLLCGSMLLFLDLAANASGIHGQVAFIGLVMVAIGGSCLWADFFEVTSWFARERWVTVHVPHMIHAAFLPKVLHKRGASVEEKSQAGDAEHQVQEVMVPVITVTQADPHAEIHVSVEEEMPREIN